MSVPAGAQSYCLPSGEQFFWSGPEGRWVFPAQGIRLTPEQLEHLRARGIGLQEYLASRSSSQQSSEYDRSCEGYHGTADQTRSPRSLFGTSAPSSLPSSFTIPGGYQSVNYIATSTVNNSGGIGYEPSTTFQRNPQTATQVRQNSASQSSVSSTTTPSNPSISPLVRYASYGPNAPQSATQAGYSGPQYRTTTNPTASTTSSSTAAMSGSSVRNVTQYGTRQPAPEPSTASTASPRRPSVSYSPSERFPTQITNSMASGAAVAQTASLLGQMALQPSSHTQQLRSGRDHKTQVAFNNVYGPPQFTTSRDLLQEGIVAGVRIIGSPGEAEVFDDGYRVRKQPRKFFVQGKVFRVLWSEPAGDGNETVTSYTRDTRFGQGIHSKVRRFVVIREGDNYCAAVPIMTYGDQGVAKQGVKKSDCAIIYIGKSPPTPRDSERARLPGEAPMRPNPIRVDPDERGTMLSPMSRINFGKVSTVEHNVKVKSFGMVNRDSMRDLLYQFRDVWDEMFEPRRPLAPAVNVASPSNAQSTLTTYAASATSRDQGQARAQQGISRQSAPSVASQARSHRSVPSNTARSVRSGRSGNVSRRQEGTDESDESDTSEE